MSTNARRLVGEMVGKSGSCFLYWRREVGYLRSKKGDKIVLYRVRLNGLTKGQKNARQHQGPT